MPDSNHVVWRLARLAIIGLILVAMLWLGYDNGFSLTADLPTILAVLAALAGVDYTQSKCRQDDKPKDSEP